jgi:SAM-dependent methyltransferase
MILGIQRPAVIHRASSFSVTGFCLGAIGESSRQNPECPGPNVRENPDPCPADFCNESADQHPVCTPLRLPNWAPPSWRTRPHAAGHNPLMALYDTIGTTYAVARRPDPRIGALIEAALGDARTVVNVGAGTGSYEPSQTVLAVEPSPVMIGQRPSASAPAVRARAEALPLDDNTADAAMALLTVHHWTDLAAGLAELKRVARRRVVILTWDHRITGEFWLLSEYMQEISPLEDARAVPIDRLVDLLGRARIETVPVPHDCTDGFGAAYWRRPEAYLDPIVRGGMSMMSQHGVAAVQPGLARLAADLESGRWHERHGDLLQRDQLDAGYRLLIAET